MSAQGRRCTSVEPGFPFHVGVAREPGLFCMLLVRRGVARLLGGGGGITLLPGSLALLPPGCARKLMGGPDSEISGFSFGASVVDPLALDADGEPVYEALGFGRQAAGASPSVARLRPETFREACSLFTAIESEAAGERPGYQAMVRLRVMEAILLLYREVRGQGARTDRAAGRFRLEEVERFLRERYADELSLGGIAARYGLNPSYLSRRFHEEAGVPLVAYINKIRIQRSCLLLKRTTMSILEVSLAVGYNNLSHFNRYFRRVVGMSPREYRATGPR